MAKSKWQRAKGKGPRQTISNGKWQMAIDRGFFPVIRSPRSERTLTVATTPGQPQLFQMANGKEQMAKDKNQKAKSKK
jgi:hypothetical protein